MSTTPPSGLNPNAPPFIPGPRPPSGPPPPRPPPGLPPQAQKSIDELITALQTLDGKSDGLRTKAQSIQRMKGELLATLDAISTSLDTLLVKIKKGIKDPNLRAKLEAAYEAQKTSVDELMTILDASQLGDLKTKIDAIQNKITAIDNELDNPPQAGGKKRRNKTRRNKKGANRNRKSKKGGYVYGRSKSRKTRSHKSKSHKSQCHKSKSHKSQCHKSKSHKSKTRKSH